MRYYGFRRSPADAKDFVANVSGLTILPSVDLRTGPMPAVFDQGQLGSCTANAVEACAQFDSSLDLGTRRARRRSRLDIYYGERSLEGSLGQGDTGAYGRDGFKFLQQTGALLESAWPYNISTFEDTPPAGTRHKLTKSYAVVAQDIDHVKAVLSNNQMIAFGFTVYPSFESAAVAAHGIVSMPGSGESSIGGHEVCAVGYLPGYENYVLCRNSWSAGWGIDGYFLMPWSYLLDADLASDLRTIVRPL